MNRLQILSYPTPFGLSLTQPSRRLQEPFDKLRANGFWIYEVGLQIALAKRITALHAARLQANVEPLGALCAGAVSKAVWAHIAC